MHNSNHYGTHDEDVAINDDEYFDYRGFSKNSRKSNNKMAASSLPVNIPRQHGATVFHCGGEADEYDNGGMVPPHVILARRIAGKMAFSVCTSNGRTLKRRDLSQVQNSVLRMTGFLEV
ncbi:hypothetical protein ERO13_A06G135204v2 [Gossypium hirsutum]|uniref:Senescence regulator n=2 Tax=Gossypium TaxID=3633 RepID=A0A5D2YWM1_GOSMU|nr:hypothetical protein ERO13_A06G135204v2 [Gossypium hirsutum]TYI23361.1 hypothetical protein ES332_A06G160200v1 [Gossypium tomentosum]TYJ30682.1 hypothetical protein E1A91_A06G147200v1 [Gossypium mustelinum]